MLSIGELSLLYAEFPVFIYFYSWYAIRQYTKKWKNKNPSNQIDTYFENMELGQT